MNKTKTHLRCPGCHKADLKSVDWDFVCGACGESWKRDAAESFSQGFRAGQNLAHTFPDIGPDPLRQSDLVDKSEEGSRKRLSDIACVQQFGVPDQTCLVWRADANRVAAELIWRRIGWDSLKETNERLIAAITKHHAQKADDRCIEDDDRLYAAANLPPCDRRVGDKAAMLRNCERFIKNRCEGGGWPSYAELEKKRDELIRMLELAAYKLWGASLTGTGALSQLYESMKHPVPGDLVIETSTLSQAVMRHEKTGELEPRGIHGIGFLLKDVREPICTLDEWRKDANEGDVPDWRVIYLRLFDGREMRWTNADIIKVPIMCSESIGAPKK